MLTLVFRTLLIYFILLISIRLMGKRQLGELQITELIVTFMLSELATAPIVDKHIPISHAVVPIILLLSLEIAFSFAVSRIPFLKRLMFGSPDVIISKGRIIQRALSKNRIDLCELLSELRLKDIADPSEVEYAILEDNGKISVIKKASKSPLTPEAVGSKVKESGIAHPLIIYGKTSNIGLNAAGKTPEWLKQTLRESGLAQSDVFLMTVNDSEEVSIIKKSTNG